MGRHHHPHRLHGLPAVTFPSSSPCRTDGIRSPTWSISKRGVQMYGQWPRPREVKSNSRRSIARRGPCKASPESPSQSRKPPPVRLLNGPITLRRNDPSRAVHRRHPAASAARPRVAASALHPAHAAALFAHLSNAGARPTYHDPISPIDACSSREPPPSLPSSPILPVLTKAACPAREYAMAHMPDGAMP